MRANRMNNGMGCGMGRGMGTGVGRGVGGGFGPGNGRGMGRGMGMNAGTRTCIWNYPIKDTEILKHQKTILEERLRFVEALMQEQDDAKTTQV